MALLRSKSKARGASSKRPEPARTFAWNKLIPVAVLLLLSAMALGLYQAGSVVLSQPVTRVLVNGDFRHVEQREIVDQVQPFLTEGFMLLDLAAISQQLLQHPWIFDVTLSRRWPGQVQIAVIEQTPIARWGNSAYLNHRGELFEPASPSDTVLELPAATSLPLLRGPDGSATQVMNHFRELGTALSQEQLTLSQLTLNDRGNWSARLDNGISIVLGAGEIMEKIRRFLFTWQQGLSADFSNIETIDMRYNNGFAVAWKATDKQG